MFKLDMCAYGCYLKTECCSLVDVLEQINCLFCKLNLPVISLTGKFNSIAELIRIIERTVKYYLGPNDWIFIQEEQGD